MSLSILNNISSLTAENALSNTQASLQKTLTQLSTGLRINSGADDAAGLSIANGLQANIAALTQSQLNASNGIGLFQTADGALSQVTSLLNRAVTLATEASNSTLNTSGSQAQALDTEFQSILSTVNTIGSTTEFNGQSVFTNSSVSIAMSDGTSTGNMTVSKTIGALTTGGLGLGNGTSLGTATLSASGAPANGDTVTVGGTTYKFVTSVAGDTTANDVQIGGTAAASLQNLADAVNGVSSGAGSEYTSTTNANANVNALAVQGTDLTFQAKNSSVSGALASVTVTPAGATSTLSFINNETTLSAGNGGTVNLLTTTAAASALTALTTAISTIAGQRGTVGAAVNQLQSASNIMNTQVQNLQGAENSVMNADIGKTVANMTQYNVLQSTGMSALQQSNQAQQAVLKLLQ
ncbi:MAG: flagellin [Acidobacteriota bacterium]